MTAIATAIHVAGGPVALARAIGAHSPDVSRWGTGHRPIPPDRCPAIERATDGRVTCEDLRPDVRWVRVPDADWPHPAGRPCIDVAGAPQPDPAPAAEPQPQPERRRIQAGAPCPDPAAWPLADEQRRRAA